jgi:hypothetical protein
MTLLFEGSEVGRIDDAFVSDGTWHGKLALTKKIQDAQVFERLLEFIAFCENWNERLATGAKANRDDFKAFADIIETQLWETTMENGRRSRVSDAPNFFSGGEISWKYSE